MENANLCLKTQDKDLKIELKNKWCIEKINFKLLRLWMYKRKSEWQIILFKLIIKLACISRGVMIQTLIMTSDLVISTMMSV